MALLNPVPRRPHRLLALAALALLLPALLAGGCGKRERSNPLDPRNPTTAGSPTGFTAVALSGQVLLSWNLSPGPGTQIFRRTGPSGSFVAISDVLPRRNTLFTDGNAPNDVTYYYRLHFVASQGVLGPAATAEATPSRVVAWVADATRLSLIRLGADGREIAFEEPAIGSPVHLAIDPVRDLLWIADPPGGRVLIYVAALGVRVAIPGFLEPSVIAIDPADGSAWISDFEGNVVRHVLSDGSPGTPSSIALLDGPLGVDVDPVSSNLWVCERRGGRIRRFAANGTPQGTVDLAAPSRVSVDSLNGEGWVTSFETGRLVHFATNLTAIHTITSLSGPVGVAVDPRRGRIWVADPVASQVIAFRRDGTEEFRVHGLVGARDLAVERASGEAWVTVNGAIARVSPGGPGVPAGTVLATSRGLSAPIGIALDRLAN